MEKANNSANSANLADPVWATSRTAVQIYDLGEVEKTDEPGSKLPQGDERPEQFVMEVGEYFERLDTIQTSIRSALSHIRRSRIAPSAINAPPPGFVPPSLGIGLPNESSSGSINRGLQEEKVDRDAWKGILEGLTRLKAERDAERREEAEESNAMKE
ncbi:hypothetical protein DFP72DRAFT_812994 [Ephemerocybe angulata]|uniref:Mediator complex subunit 11 n=1 Tax=Ephemerocybe angulata TaxID=980116 RepID=A0A8H6HXT3_9AGAR|nr:hypothetical protein DFP72DRAFT_812994 [Tulosesus angulatus]